MGLVVAKKKPPITQSNGGASVLFSFVLRADHSSAQSKSSTAKALHKSSRAAIGQASSQALWLHAIQLKGYFAFLAVLSELLMSRVTSSSSSSASFIAPINFAAVAIDSTLVSTGNASI